LAETAVLAWDVKAIIDVAIASPPLIPRRTHAEKVVELILARSAVLTRVWSTFVSLHITVDALPAYVAGTSVLV
jgi:hypothetical protein